MEANAVADGVHARVPRERMSPAVRKMWDTYERVPGAPLYRREFGYYCLERWAEQGMPQDVPFAELFDYDRAGAALAGPARLERGRALSPTFEVKVLEDRGEHEVVQDFAGRHVLCFKGRRNGFMPEYLDHPVKDMQHLGRRTCKWRLDPASPERYADLDQRMAEASAAAAEGMMICQNLIGGYMYLRSLIGPEELLYAFYDMPELIHDCMQTWLDAGRRGDRPPPAARDPRRAVPGRGHLLQPRPAHLART